MRTVWMRWLVGLPWMVAVGSLALDVRASGHYPPVIAAELSMPCTPQCVVCHLTNAGGFNNMKPDGFAGTLKRQYGLVPYEESSIGPAVRAARAAGAAFDTDADGMNDVDEAAVGRNPNIAGEAAYLAGCEGDGGVVTQVPVYGCARVAPGDQFDDVAAVFGGAVVAAGAGALRLRSTRASRRR